MKALGFIETRGFVSATEAADSALKSAHVSLVSKKLPGSGLVTVIVTGDVAAVKAAVEAGASSAAAVGEVVSVQVIASPHADLEAIIFDEAPAKKTPARAAGKAAKPAAKKPAAGKNEEKPGV